MTFDGSEWARLPVLEIDTAILRYENYKSPAKIQKSTGLRDALHTTAEVV